MTVSLPTHLVDDQAQAPFMLLHHYHLSRIHEMRHISYAHQQHFGIFFKIESNLSYSNFHATE